MKKSREGEGTLSKNSNAVTSRPLKYLMDTFVLNKNSKLNLSNFVLSQRDNSKNTVVSKPHEKDLDSVKQTDHNLPRARFLIQSPGE